MSEKEKLEVKEQEEKVESKDNEKKEVKPDLNVSDTSNKVYQSRKWLITINNFLEFGFTRESIKDKLNTMNLRYWCMGEEIGNVSKIHHIHIFICSDGGIRNTTLKKKFPVAHLDACIGTCAQNRDYIRKEGKYADSEKADTSIPGTFEEWGEMPAEKEEINGKKAKVISMIKEGKTNYEILDEVPSEAYYIQKFNEIRQMYLFKENESKPRSIDVFYLFGKTGTGKTSSIFRKYKPSEICRITSYTNGVRFDSYDGQKVLVFEEFKGQIPLKEMLNYLDIYPLRLPARYADKIAAYTVVYITSNDPIESLYITEQIKYPESYRAFLRRINRIWEYVEFGEPPIKIKDDDPPKIDEDAFLKGENEDVEEK